MGGASTPFGVSDESGAGGVVIGELPPPDTIRWVARRKAAVIAAVRDGRIDLSDALSRYQISAEEYRSWERTFDQRGLRGLQATVTYRKRRQDSARPVLVN
jgi:hypothetical protein